MLCYAGYFEVMFTQQVAPYNQNLGVTITSHMHMNWLLRFEAFLWYFLPPVTSVLILWWLVLSTLSSLHAPYLSLLVTPGFIDFSSTLGRLHE